MNRITSARTELFEALSYVLPGRVAATPPSTQPYVAPYIWIDQPELTIGFVGARTQLSVATFAVWIGYDGAVKSQVAGLDDLLAKVWDACLRVPAARPTGSRTQFVDVNGIEVRGHVVSVDVTLGGLTLCLPEVAAAPIPPEPVPA